VEGNRQFSRAAGRVIDVVLRPVRPLLQWLCFGAGIRYMRFVPSLPATLRYRTRPGSTTWPAWTRETPDALRTVAGIRRDPELELAAFEERPLEDFWHRWAAETLWLYRQIWKGQLPTAGQIRRAMLAAHRTAKVRPAVRPAATDPDELTRAVKAEAARVGLSATGVAGYDPKYTLREYASTAAAGDRVIVCIVEQSYGATQTIPSLRADRATMSAYAQLMQRASRLANFLHERGYRAHTHDYEGQAIVIHYGVEAGLGQLGLNGQLLTPWAGSRCRITIITTDAPLLVDHPVDYGIPAVCDSCQACIRRCPASALTPVRKLHRGVEKAKLNTERCFPVMAQANDCAICMKVCPVQRYGLPAVLDEYERTGGILGRDTDELEGYVWPLDGRRYGPGEKPRLERSFFRPPELSAFDPLRKREPDAHLHPVGEMEAQPHGGSRA
jgi:ferredoxin